MMIADRIAKVLLLATLLLALFGLLLHPGRGLAVLEYFDAYFKRVVWFSFYQAFLSALLSVAIALPLAIVISYQAFKGAWIVKSVLNLFFIMPVLTVVLAVVALFSPWFSVYGLFGIVTAHVLLNFPFALRLLWDRLSRMSEQQKQLADVLGLHPWTRFKVLQLPLLLSSIKPAFIVIFLLCFSSFTIVLTLGGGPANTNLEVAIFQALKFDFDAKAAAIYALVHGLFAFVLIITLGRRQAFRFEVSATRSQVASWPSRWQIVALAMLAVLLFTPIVSLVVKAFSIDFVLPKQFWPALLNSLLIAFFSAVVALLLAFARSKRANTPINQLLDFGVLVLPTMVITTGLFLVALRAGIAFQVTWLFIIWMNALMALPIISSPVHSKISAVHARYHQQVTVIGMSRLASLRYIYWPHLRPVLGWVMMLSMVLSVGDLGVAALVGSAQFVTLPILIYQAMGSYQLTLATQLSLILLVLSMVLLLLGEWMGETR